MQNYLYHTRMATLSDGGRISLENVNDEIERLLNYWNINNDNKLTQSQEVEKLLGQELANQYDLFDHFIIAGISKVCKQSSSMAEAGRSLFNYSRTQKASINDTHRLKQLLKKYHLDFGQFNQ